MSEMRTAQDQQILITRVFDAPRELVFQAWTDPDRVAQSFGPDGFETPRETVTIDLRVGGRYELGMVRRSPLHDHDDKTRMSLSDGPYTHSAHAEAGWNGAFAMLDAMLA